MSAFAHSAAFEAAAPLFANFGPSAPFAVACGLTVPALFMAWQVSKAVRKSA